MIPAIENEKKFIKLVEESVTLGLELVYEEGRKNVLPTSKVFPSMTTGVFATAYDVISVNKINSGYYIQTFITKYSAEVMVESLRCTALCKNKETIFKIRPTTVLMSTEDLKFFIKAAKAEKSLKSKTT